MRIVILAVGSRGDVQPYVALGRGLKQVGHDVLVATHGQFRDFVASHGLRFYGLIGDVKEMLSSRAGQLWLQSGQNPLRFVRQFTEILEPLHESFLINSFEACRDAQILVFSTLAISGYHIVEALKIPGFYAPLQPMTRSGEIPFVQLAGNLRFGKTVNWWTHIVTEQMLWQPLRRTLNRWRQKTLGLPKHPFCGGFDLLYKNKKPFIYGFSSLVFPKPKDWPAWHHVTGYWFLDEQDWRPSAELKTFLEDGPAPVYIGFGSMVFRSNGDHVLDVVLDAAEKNGVRLIIQEGWADWSADGLPDWVLKIGFVPHDWLFPKMAAVVHHGGAGTTAAGIRAGIPSVVVPFFADQPFWARCVAQLGIAPEPISGRELTAHRLAYAIRRTTNREMKARAAALGKKIKEENGVEKAVEVMHHHLKMSTYM